jgi:hypothetical protein
MSNYRIYDETYWTLTGRKTRRRIEGEPTFEALKAWRDGENIGAPSMQWLKAAIDDTLNRAAIR